MNRIYFDHASERERQHFPTGVAAIAVSELEFPLNQPDDIDLPINAATYQALFQLGVVDRLQHLPMQFGPIDNCEEAKSIAIEREYDLLVACQVSPLGVEYRVKCE